MTFAAWLKEVNNNPCLNDNAYIMDVWAPEVNEPPHDKTNKMSVRPVNTQISLGIGPV